jgi:hypothetical protein
MGDEKRRRISNTGPRTNERCWMRREKADCGVVSTWYKYRIVRSNVPSRNQANSLLGADASKTSAFAILVHISLS